MSNKKGIIIGSLLLIIAGTVLTGLLDEAKFGHIFFHLFIISVAAFALCISIKDIVIILMISASVVWVFGMFDILSEVNQLLVETVIIISVASMLGWKEFRFKGKKIKQEHVLSYKKEQVAELKKEMEALNKENSEILDKIKKYRKTFAG